MRNRKFKIGDILKNENHPDDWPRYQIVSYNYNYEVRFYTNDLHNKDYFPMWSIAETKKEFEQDFIVIGHENI